MTGISRTKIESRCSVIANCRVASPKLVTTPTASALRAWTCTAPTHLTAACCARSRPPSIRPKFLPPEGTSRRGARTDERCRRNVVFCGRGPSCQRAVKGSPCCAARGLLDRFAALVLPGLGRVCGCGVAVPGQPGPHHWVRNRQCGSVLPGPLLHPRNQPSVGTNSAGIRARLESADRLPFIAAVFRLYRRSFLSSQTYDLRNPTGSGISSVRAV